MKQNDNNIPDPNPHRIKRSINARVKWLYVFFAMLAILILVQILLTQWGPNGTPLRNLSKERCYTVRTVQGSRGNIYDRGGRLLSTDSKAYTIRLDFAVQTLADSTFYRNLGALSDSLGRMFGRPSGFYRNFLTETFESARKGGDRYKLLARHLNQRQFDRLRTFPLMDSRRNGVLVEEERTRYKVYGSLASYTISQGIEKAYDSILRSTDGINRFVKLDALNRAAVPIYDTINRPSRNGDDIITTIDVDLQDVVEGALRKRLMTNDAVSGTAVVMECSTGEIRAMANLTHYYGGQMEDDFNYAIKWYGDPGSTFKGVSLLVLLDDAHVSLDKRVDCGQTGSIVINGLKVTDTHHVGITNVKGMFAQSSNVGFAKVVNEYYADDPDRFINRIRAIGIDGGSDIQSIKGLPFRLKDTSSKNRRGGWSGTTLTQNAYGYELNLTPMHTLVFYNAVANNGQLVKPLLVKKVLRDGEMVKEYPTEVVNPAICSPETLVKLKECMETVVEEGTGKQLRSLPFKVAGKTGTAQVYQQVRRKGARTVYETADGGREYLATFVGFFPADAPKYTCVVAIKTHRAPGNYKEYTGAGVSAPVFREIAEYVYTHDSAWMPAAERTAASVSRKKTSLDEVAVENGVMPSVTGMGLSDALYLLSSMGLHVTPEGKGAVVWQSIPAGTAFTEGTDVVIRLAIKTDKNTISNTQQ